MPRQNSQRSRCESKNRAREFATPSGFLAGVMIGLAMVGLALLVL